MVGLPMMLDVTVDAAHDHAGHFERFSGIERRAHLHARFLQRRILGIAKQARHHLFTDLGVRRPHNGIACPPAIQDAGVVQIGGAGALQDFRGEEAVKTAALVGGKHLCAAAVDGKVACELENAIDRERNQTGAIAYQDEAVFAVEWGRCRGPVRFGRLPVYRDDAVHRIHHSLPVGVADAGRIWKTKNCVVNPWRRDDVALVAQISQHRTAPALRSLTYTGEPELA